MRTPTASQREAIEEDLALQRNRQALPRAKGGCCLVNLAWVVMILGLGLAFALGFDYFNAPWS
jgi:hypothetical protein